MLTFYHSICAFLCEADVATLNSINFGELCLRFHADPSKVDRALYSIFGMSGDDIIRQYIEGPLSV